MAERIIMTTPFRASFTHLAEAYLADGATGEAKFQIAALFPKNGMLPAHIGQVPSSIDNIKAALNEVCMEHFGVPFDAAGVTMLNGGDYAAFVELGWTDEQMIAAGHAVVGQGAAAQFGITYPPSFVDGDTDWKTGENRQKLIGQPKEECVGMWRTSFKNVERVGVVNAGDAANNIDPVDIDPKAVYSGCWCRAEIEVSAYTTKTKNNVIAIKLLNVQMMFDDTNLSGKTQTQSAVSAFAGKAVAGTNIAMGYGQTMAAVPAPQAHTAPAAPAPAPAPASAAPVETCPVIMLSGGDYQAFKTAGWTDEALIANGHATANAAAPAPQAVPQAPAPQAAPQAPAPQAAPQAPAPQAPAPQAAPQAPAPSVYLQPPAAPVA